MNLLQLKYFQEIARYQNITKAAEALHVSQPSLSTSIKHLEAELGIDLFDRKGKSIVLNENGQNFLRDINSVFELLERNQQKKNIQAGGRNQEISIGGEKSELMLSSFIAGFVSRYPDVRITFRNSVKMATLDPEILDFFIYAEPAGKDKRGKLVLEREGHSILLSKQHPLAACGDVSLSMIREEPFVFVTPHSGKMPPGYRICCDSGFQPNVACITDERTVMLSLMADSRLVSIVPSSDARAFTHIGAFVAFPVDQARERDIVLSVPARKPLSPIAGTFLEELAQVPEIQRLNPALDRALFDSIP